MAALREGHCDSAIGSRAIDRKLIQIRQPRLRELAGIIFNYAARCLTGVPFHDTQCGFKAFQLERARVIFEQQRTPRFGFDPEILFLAGRHGLRVVEIPICWAHDRASKVNILSDSIGMLLELLSIRWNELLGRYPAEALSAASREASMEGVKIRTARATKS